MHFFSKRQSESRCLLALVILFSALLILTSPNPARCSRSYNNARDSYYSLIRSNSKKKFRHNWERSINKFIKVTKSKNDPKVVDATFMLGEMYRMLYTYSTQTKDLKTAIKYYEKVAVEFPKSSLSDDSIYKVGEIYEKKLNDYKSAYNAYSRVIKKYSSGDMASKARSKLIKLKKYAPVKKKPRQSVKKDNRREKQIASSGLTLIEDILYWSEDDSTRIVIYPKHSIDYRYNFLNENVPQGKGARLYIDLYNTQLNPKIENVVNVKDGLLTTIRSEQHDKEVVRVVLDVESINSYRVFSFENPFRVIIDISGEKVEKISRYAKKDAKEYKPINAIKPKANQQNKEGKNSRKNRKSNKSNEKINITLAKQLGLNVKKIVIDPGHGGRDPGAVGLNKTKEKDITLKISKKLKKIIEKTLDCKVILTRSKDKFLSLEARTAIAKKVKADLFISIHTNSSDKGRLSGIETYYLNFASDANAAKTAARENATSHLTLSDLGDILKVIKYSNVDESRELAHDVQREIVRELSKSYKDVKNLGVKQAPFYVLYGSRKPSILIETSFINHKVEGKRLQTDKYITSLAESICNGISKYIDGFNLAAKTQN